MGTLYQRFSLHYYPQILHGKPVPEETFQQFEEALKCLENQATYVAGESLSITDFASITTIKVAAGLDLCHSGSSTASWLRVSPVTTKSAFRDPKNLPHSLPTLRNKDKQAMTSFIFDRAHQVAPSHAHAVLFFICLLRLPVPIVPRSSLASRVFACGESRPSSTAGAVIAQ
uniref:Glutathione S-transferase 1, isoform C n=1 Tax=Culex pipiens TaxID=7175 RepID=A0A8D8CFE6_CULPI